VRSLRDRSLRRALQVKAGVMRIVEEASTTTHQSSSMSDDKSLAWTEGSPIRYVLWYLFRRTNPKAERANWRKAWLLWCGLSAVCALVWRLTGDPTPLLLVLLLAALPILMWWLMRQWHDPDMERTFEAETAKLVEGGNCFRCGRPRSAGEENICRFCRTETDRIRQIGVATILLLALAWLAIRSLK
jgi:hypothetical protein